MKSEIKLYPPSLEDLKNNLNILMEYHANQNFRLSKFVNNPKMSNDTKPIRIFIPLEVEGGSLFSLEGVRKILHLMTLGLNKKQKLKLSKQPLMLLIYPISSPSDKVLGLYVMTQKPLQDDILDTIIINLREYNDEIKIRVNDGLMEYICDPIYSEDELLAYDEYLGFVNECKNLETDLKIEELKYLLLNGIFNPYFDGNDWFCMDLNKINYDNILPLFAGKPQL